MVVRTETACEWACCPRPTGLGAGVKAPIIMVFFAEPPPGGGGGMDGFRAGGGGGGVELRRTIGASSSARAAKESRAVAATGLFESLNPQYLHRTARTGSSFWHAGHRFVLLISTVPRFF